MSVQTVSWINGSNVYEVNIRQYTSEGTFKAFTQHLPRLKDMNVEILWLMPVTPISIEKRQGSLGSYYACNNYTAINPEFGTLEDFKNLVALAHKLDMKLIIDWVANHTGWDHPWTKEHPDWYIKDEHGNFIEKNGWLDVIDLDYENLRLRKAMIAAMKFWITECDIDGFRCDMAHLVPLDFWKQARKECDLIKPLFWLAECEVIEYHEAFDVTYAWEWMHISEKIVKGFASLQHLKYLLNTYSQYPVGAKKLFFTSNHDENSWNGTEYEKYGNAARALAVFTCTWPGIPLIYSGQELPNYKRLLFFDKDSIDWTTNIALHNFYQALLSLQKNNTALQNGSDTFMLNTNANDKIFAYLCINNNYKVLVILNLSNDDRIHCTITDDQLQGRYQNLFSGIQHNLQQSQHFELQAWEYMVYVTAKG